MLRQHSQRAGWIAATTAAPRRLEEILVGKTEIVVLSETFEDGPALLRHACALGLEGIVSKRLESTYRSGRSTDWVKTKCPDYVRP